MDVNPQVSKSLCWLIEKMLAKDKEDRHSSWQSVRADIARVKKGYMPHGRPIPQGSSTIDRNELRTPLDFVQAALGCTTGMKITGEGGARHDIDVRIPAGVAEGSKTGQGFETSLDNNSCSTRTDRTRCCRHSALDGPDTRSSRSAPGSDNRVCRESS